MLEFYFFLTIKLCLPSSFTFSKFSKTAELGGIGHRISFNANQKLDIERINDTSLKLENNGEEGGKLIEEKILMTHGNQCKQAALIERVAEKKDGLLFSQPSFATPIQAYTPKMSSQSTPSSIKIPTSLPRIIETIIDTPTGSVACHGSSPFQTPYNLKKSVTPQKTQLAKSPVGLYIRSFPEPILIENVRSTRKMKHISNPPIMSKPSVPGEEKDTEHCPFVVRDPATKSSSVSSKENISLPTDIRPVLPTVLHKAAAQLVSFVFCSSYRQLSSVNL